MSYKVKQDFFGNAMLRHDDEASDIDSGPRNDSTTNALGSHYRWLKCLGFFHTKSATG